MEKSSFNRNLLLVMLTIFVFVFGIQIADPVSAAFTPATGTKYITSTHGNHYKYHWRIYKVGKNRAVIKATLTTYDPQSSYAGTVSIMHIFDKINKKQIRAKYYLNYMLMANQVMKNKYAKKYSAYTYAKWFNYGQINEYKKL